jgi:hypothetical protein
MLMDNNSTNYATEQFIERIPEVPNTAFVGSAPAREILNDDFMTCSKNFWRIHESGKYRLNYDAGMINGTYNKLYPSLETLFQLITSAVKVQVQTMAIAEDKEASNLELHLKNLELAQDMVCEKMSESFKNDIDGQALMSYIHGMLNNFVNKNIRKG